MAALRDLPAVDQVVARLRHLFPAKILTSEVRAVLAERRRLLLEGHPTPESSVDDEVEARLRKLLAPSLRRVINATGVVLHTNLGRAPIGKFQPIEGASNLEFDLETGRRGKRDAHTAPLLERLLGRPGIVVNNNAAAVYLVLHELAANGGEVIVSRGELIEIGDGFRIPEIMARSGAQLREVGTTNRTSVDDYRAAVNDRTRVIMRVHRSNFHLSGFTSQPSLAELAALAREVRVPLYEDLGSGCVVDLRTAGVLEPLVSESFEAGANMVSFSCDKLLGGPQSGIIAGDAELIGRIRHNFMYRAFRVDKLIVECLERTLRSLLFESWENLPAIEAILTSVEVLRERALAVQAQLRGASVRVRESRSPIGGGSTPDSELRTWVVEIETDDPDALAARLRACEMPVIARIERGCVVVDLRAVAETELDVLIWALRESCSTVD